MYVPAIHNLGRGVELTRELDPRLDLRHGRMHEERGAGHWILMTWSAAESGPLKCSKPP